MVNKDYQNLSESAFHTQKVDYINDVTYFKVSDKSETGEILFL